MKQMAFEMGKSVEFSAFESPMSPKDRREKELREALVVLDQLEAENRRFAEIEAEVERRFSEAEEKKTRLETEIEAQKRREEKDWLQRRHKAEAEWKAAKKAWEA